ncbi:hypothetical protein WEI85_19445 [Actinomycetes bacterium KLBMP 9797]
MKEVVPLADPNDPTDEMGELRARTGRLEIMLVHARRSYADLVAACRAALNAWADGEPDPLWYVRDQLPRSTTGNPPPPEGDR